MVNTGFEYEMVFIPLTGICILILLLIGTLFEPGRDYSKRAYILMLSACAGVLITEMLQSRFSGQGTDGGQAALAASYLAFYIFIVALCYLWIPYSYYWFNDRAPSAKTCILFAIGPMLEIVALLANLLTGAIYRIDSSGLYVRGGTFTPFIAFCYLYLIASITITALLAKRNSKESRHHDLLLFLLFFIFPIIGPIVQYLFAELSVMGISESIALLAIFVAVQQRVTARHAVERALLHEASQKYEQSLERLLSTRPDALCVFRLNLTQDTHSEAQSTSCDIARMLGPDDTTDGLIGMVAALITDEDEARHFSRTFGRKHLLQVFAQGQTRVSAIYHRTVENGESHRINTYLDMLENPDSGDIEGIIYSVDTDRQEKDEKVISAITSREYDYIALIDVRTSKVHYQYLSDDTVSPEFFKLGDYDRILRERINLECGREDPDDLFGMLSLETVSQALEHSLEYSSVYSYTDSSERSVQKKSTFRYLDERRTEILFFRSDITEEMRHEHERSEALRSALQQAQHADAMKTEFLSNVSHDIRTPLNAILGYTGLAERSTDPAEIRDFLDKIDSAGNTLLSLVNDTLDLSRIETGIVILKPEPVKLMQIIDKTVETVRPMCERKEISLILDCADAEGMTVTVDALRLGEILTNLLSNAAKFTHEQGDVSLAVERGTAEGDRTPMKISVCDTGCGMSADFLTKVYEPFTRECSAGTDEPEGSGLGLSIVKRLVEMMDGTIEVESELGKGSCFTVRLELQTVDAIPEQVEHAERSWDELRGRTILMAEDNDMNTEIARLLLEKHGMTVICVRNGQEACRTFAESRPGDIDAILMDIRMPVMSGRDAISAIRQMDRADATSVPIIALSADAFDDDIDASLAAGADAHIAKPIIPDRLFGALSEALAANTDIPG